jgi:hypothetical protein
VVIDPGLIHSAIIDLFPGKIVTPQAFLSANDKIGVVAFVK